MSRHFQFDWRLLLLLIIFLPTMISLGFWQLRRADENRALIDSAAEKRQQKPVAFEELHIADLENDVATGRFTAWQHLPVTLHGRWATEVFLFEDQVEGGRNGYHIIGVMVLANGERILVNRGWTLAPSLRSKLPDYPSVVNNVEETGELYITPNILGDGPVFAEAGWPRRIGALQIASLEKELGSTLLPFMVRLHEGSPSALTAHWPVVNIAPEKNIAYAIQWFGMSFALVACYLAFSFRRTNIDKTDNEVVNG